jgi:prepilin-type N-terminal cleavage/methylation domain-containing protein
MRILRKESGFTILEMAISLAIAGIAIVALFKLLSTTILSTERADQVAIETMLARSKLLEAMRMEPALPGVQTGMAPGGSQWSVETTPLDSFPAAANGNRSLVAITVSVRGPGARREGADIRLRSLAFLALQ